MAQPKCKLGRRRDGKCRRTKCPRKLTKSGMCPPSARRRTRRPKRSCASCCAPCRVSRKRRR